MKMVVVSFLASFLLCCCLVFQRVQPLNVLAFNIKNFGQSKYSKQPVIDVLIDIFELYDLILVMELVDVSQTVLPGFIQQLNSHVENRSIQFNYTISDRLGRSNNKEQYVFVYRTDYVEIIDTYQYPDESDNFERPPYAVLVHSIKPESGSIPPFFIIASHTKPTDAVNEINNLTTVFYEAKNAFSTDLGVIMGDLNADCSYVSNAKYDMLDLVKDTNFTWWIDKLADTTTSASDCAYDRIITRSSLNSFVANNSVGIFYFDTFFNLSSELTLDVSDHYPIQISFEGVVSVTVPTATSSSLDSALPTPPTPLITAPLTTTPITTTPVIIPFSFPTASHTASSTPPSSTNTPTAEMGSGSNSRGYTSTSYMLTSILLIISSILALWVTTIFLS